MKPHALILGLTKSLKFPFWGFYGFYFRNTVIEITNFQKNELISAFMCNSALFYLIVVKNYTYLV